MTDVAWRSVAAALDEAGAEAPVQFWLRDDDAVEVTPALRRLGDLSRAHAAPLLLAVIPAGATSTLAAWTREQNGIMPCQHGYAHINHAAAPERACELGGARDDAAVMAELAAGRAAMVALFGAAWSPVLVPPWNRIRPSLLPHLPHLGYRGLSTFVGSALPAVHAMPRLDCDLDIIDWRNGRRGRSDEDCCRRLVALIAASRATGAPIGVLTHHLVHDDQAWRVLDQVLALLGDHPGAVFTSAGALLAAQP